MESYNIQIPNDKATTYKVVTLIISIINLLGVGYMFVARGERNITSLITLVVAITALISALSFIRKVSPKPFLRPWWLLAICAFIWIFWGHYYLGVPLLVFSIFSFYTAKPLVIRFSADGVRYPTAPAKLFAWREVDFVILKDDVLTIELKNNRLFQFTLEPRVAAAINPADFNSFCINAAAHIA